MPQNILYKTLREDKYKFQLADFGFANDFRLATTFCGTPLYQAPELQSHWSQTPKVGIWPLFDTILEIHPKLRFPPPDFRGYSMSDVARAVQAFTSWEPQLEPMASIDPSRRASTAQMLVNLLKEKQRCSSDPKQYATCSQRLANASSNTPQTRRANRRASQPAPSRGRSKPTKPRGHYHSPHGPSGRASVSGKSWLWTPNRRGGYARQSRRKERKCYSWPEKSQEEKQPQVQVSPN